ncbi:unnamed protein product [Boreogadus saida]
MEWTLSSQNQYWSGDDRNLPPAQRLKAAPPCYLLQPLPSEMSQLEGLCRTRPPVNHPGDLSPSGASPPPARQHLKTPDVSPEHRNIKLWPGYTTRLVN